MTEPSSDLRTAVPATSWPARVDGAARAAGGRPGAHRQARRGLRRVSGTVLVVGAVVALLAGVVRCSAGVGNSAVPAVPTAVIPGAGADAAPVAAVPGSLSADGTSLFDAARTGDRSLADFAGDTAIGHAVPVQSVPADEGFWVGPNDTDRVWVQLTSSGESAVTITPGQLLDLSGPVVPHGADFARKAGVAAADGAEQLTREGAHLEVDPNQVKVVGTR
jgi:hypothetical protein